MTTITYDIAESAMLSARLRYNASDKEYLKSLSGAPPSMLKSILNPADKA